MALLRQALRSGSLAAALTRPPAALPAARGFSDWVKEREGAEEAMHFRKEEKELLKKLLAKVKVQADQKDAGGADQLAAQDLARLKSILGKYNVSTPDYDALLKWKHEV